MVDIHVSKAYEDLLEYQCLNDWWQAVRIWPQSTHVPNLLLASGLILLECFWRERVYTRGSDIRKWYDEVEKKQNCIPPCAVRVASATNSFADMPGRWTAKISREKPQSDCAGLLLPIDWSRNGIHERLGWLIECQVSQDWVAGLRLFLNNGLSQPVQPSNACSQHYGMWDKHSVSRIDWGRLLKDSGHVVCGWTCVLHWNVLGNMG